MVHGCCESAGPAGALRGALLYACGALSGNGLRLAPPWAAAAWSGCSGAGGGCPPAGAGEVTSRAKWRLRTCACGVACSELDGWEEPGLKEKSEAAACRASGRALSDGAAAASVAALLLVAARRDGLPGDAGSAAGVAGLGRWRDTPSVCKTWELCSRAALGWEAGARSSSSRPRSSNSLPKKSCS